MKQISLWTVWKLRFKLWRMFTFSQSNANYRLKIRWANDFTSPIDGHRFDGYWAWTCVVDPDENVKLGMHSRGEYALGPLRQWSLQEALSLAARKAQWVLHPEQEPVREPEPNPAVPKHAKVYRLLDEGLIGLDCSCGWRSSFTKCHPERDSGNYCGYCRLAEEAFDMHQAEERYKAAHPMETKTT